MASREIGATPDAVLAMADLVASNASRLSTMSFGDNAPSVDPQVPLKRSELVSEIAVMLQKMHKQSELTLEALRNLYSLSSTPPADQIDYGQVQQLLPRTESNRSSPTDPSYAGVQVQQVIRSSADIIESQPERTPEHMSRIVPASLGAFTSPTTGTLLSASCDGVAPANSDTTVVLQGLHADIDRMLRTAEALRSFNTADTKTLYKELHNITMMPELTPEAATFTNYELAAEQGCSPEVAFFAPEKPVAVQQRELPAVAVQEQLVVRDTTPKLQASDVAHDAVTFGTIPASASHVPQRLLYSVSPGTTSRLSSVGSGRASLGHRASPMSTTFPGVVESPQKYCLSPGTTSRLSSFGSGRASLGRRASPTSATFASHLQGPSRETQELDRSSSAVGSRASPVRQLSPSPANRNMSPCVAQRTTGAGSQLVSRANASTTPLRYSSPAPSATRVVSPGPSRALSPGPSRRRSNPVAPSTDAASSSQAPPSTGSMFEVGAHTLAGVKTQCKDWINQDTHLVVPVTPDRLVVVVFDGHGVNGQHCANMAKNMFAEQASALANAGSNLENAFRVLFRNVQATLESQGLARMAGTTATAAVIDATAGTISTAYVGDSRLLAALGPRVYFETKDHTFDTAAESRVIEHGGEVREQTVAGVTARRVFGRGESGPGLSMARSLGDFECHELGVLAEPTVHCCAPFWPGCTLVVASDGVWEKLSSEQVAVEVADLETNASAAALVDKAFSHWTGDVDDITAIVVRLSKPSSSMSSTSPPSGAPTQRVANAPPPPVLSGNVPVRTSSGSSPPVRRGSPGRSNIARYSSPCASATVPTSSTPTCSTFAPLTGSSCLNGPMRYSSPTRTSFSKGHTSPSQSSRRSAEHPPQHQASPTWWSSYSPAQSCSSHGHRVGKAIS